MTVAKAKVEAGVRIAQFYILGRLRNLTFFSLAECNAAIIEILAQLNDRPMRRLGLSRRQLFDTVERPAMRSLPETDHEFAEWALARVGVDYHVAVAGFFYSVPHALIREQVDTRLTERTVEVFHRGQRVAAHARRYGGPRHSTLPEHMPSAHRRYADWSLERFQRQARSIGPNTEALILAVLARRPHPEQGFRTCLGILRLFRGLDATRAEAVSARAIEIGALNYQSVASILKHRLDHTAAPRSADGAPILHANIRGSGYYH
jgi:transposase